MKLFFRLAVIVGALPVTLTNGTTADATQVMSDLNWIVNQVNANAAPLSGTALVNANNNFTVVQSGVAATQPANFPIASQIQSSVFNTFQSTLGTNALTARMAALALTAWPTDGVFSFIPSQTNNGPANITVDSAGSSIMFSMGSTLVGGELRAGVAAIVKRDATTLQLMNPANVRFDLASSSGGGGARVLITGTPSPLRLGKAPSITTITALGSSTYTTPAGAIRLEVELVGAGGGGGGSGASTGPGVVGFNTVFDVFSATGGLNGNEGGGSPANGGGAGGTGSGGWKNTTGNGGGVGTGAATNGGAPAGGGSFFGGGGKGGSNGQNYGGGGGGGGTGAPTTNTGGAGGGGGYCMGLISNPLPTYQCFVGTGGAGGAGTGGAGGNGGQGVIYVKEFYN